MIEKTHCSPYQILDMDYYMYLALYKQFILQDLNSTEEGRKALDDAERINRKTADVDKIKQFINR